MGKNKITLIAGLLFVVAVGMIVFGGHEDPSLQDATVVNGTHNDNQPEESSTPLNLPDFELESIDGGTVKLSDYRGEKPVVLDFFATWCPNCRRDMPKLSGWYEKYKDQVEVIGINLQERERLVKNYRDEANIAFPIVLDPKAEASKIFGVQYTNYHVLIGLNGEISRVIPGDISEEQIVALIGAE